MRIFLPNLHKINWISIHYSITLFIFSISKTVNYIFIQKYIYINIYNYFYRYFVYLFYALKASLSDVLAMEICPQVFYCMTLYKYIYL